VKVFATVDADRYTRAMRDLVVRIGDDMWEPIIKEEAIQLLKGAIRLDSKMTVSGAAKLGTTARAIRERIVAYDITRTMNPLKPERLTNTDFREAIQKLIEKGDREHAQEFFDRIKRGRFRGAILTGFSRNYHRANIDPTKGTTRRTRFYLLSPMDWIKHDAYTKEIQGRVGWKYGGFNSAAANLGFKLPQWVSRHGAAPGSFSAELGKTGKARALTITNQSFKKPTFNTHIERVMALRVRAMATKVSRIIKGEAVNLGFGVIDKTGMLTIKTAQTTLEKARREEMGI
jgi:hypothetical protein